MAIEKLMRIDKVDDSADIAVNVNGRDYRASAPSLKSYVQEGLEQEIQVLVDEATEAAEAAEESAAEAAAAAGVVGPQVREALRRSYADAGHVMIGDFSDTGLVVTTATDVVLWEPTGVAYAYGGTLPHTIGAGETPIGNPLWVEKDSETLRDELAEPSGPSLIGYTSPGAGGVASTVKEQLDRFIYMDGYGAIPNSQAAAAANAAALASAYIAANLLSISEVRFATNGTYWFPPGINISNPNTVLECGGATLKQVDGPQTGNWLVVTQGTRFTVNNAIFDGNRVGAPSLHPDSSLVLVYNTTDIKFNSCVAHSSSAKGISVASGVSGIGAKRVYLNKCYGYNCAKQVFLTDRSNGVGNDTIPCEKVFFTKCIVEKTDHAGIAINDGSKKVYVTDCFLDVENSTWDALSIRGASQVKVSGTTGRRGRNGCQVSVLDAAAIARDEIAKDITFSGNTWEVNAQSGLAILGAEAVTVNGDVSKNNAQLTPAMGFNISQVAGVRRSRGITLNGVIAIDDQGVHTQTTAIQIGASDIVRISNPVMYGNVTDNRVKLVAGTGVTDFSVTGDGANGATNKKVSTTTGSIAAGGNAVVTLTFATPFDVTPNWANAAVIQGSTTSPFLRIDKITALTTAAVQVQVTNPGAAAGTGTVYAEAAYLI